jgi:hypothetical protein
MISTGVVFLRGEFQVGGGTAGPRRVRATAEAHRDRPVVHHIRADPPLRPSNQLLDLVQIVVGRPSPVLAGDRRLPGFAQRYIPRHGVVVTPASSAAAR